MKGCDMALNWKDGVATLLTAGAVGVYAALLADAGLPLVSTPRTVALAVLVLGVAACAIGARVPLNEADRVGGAVGALSKVAALAGIAGLVAIVTGSEPVLAVFVGLTVLLWLATTVRHAIGGHEFRGEPALPAPPSTGTRTATASARSTPR
jgi:hypothetical protein